MVMVHLTKAVGGQAQRDPARVGGHLQLDARLCFCIDCIHAYIWPAGVEEFYNENTNPSGSRFYLPANCH